MNVSDMTKQVMEMIEYEEGVTTKFFVMRKSDGEQ
jgi:torulene dioxygenase